MVLKLLWSLCMLDVNIFIKFNFRRTSSCICYSIKLLTFDKFLFWHLQDIHFSIIKKKYTVVWSKFLLWIDWSCPFSSLILTWLYLNIASWVFISEKRSSLSFIIKVSFFLSIYILFDISYFNKKWNKNKIKTTTVILNVY